MATVGVYRVVSLEMDVNNRRQITHFPSLPNESLHCPPFVFLAVD